VSQPPLACFLVTFGASRSIRKRPNWFRPRPSLQGSITWLGPERTMHGTAPQTFAPVCECGQQMRLVCVEPDEKYLELDKQQFACGCGDVRICSVLKLDRRSAA
jgi:hypothetical protein